MPSLSEAPSGGARALLVTFGWAGIPGSFPKVTRRKGGTHISHHPNNGYVLTPTPRKLVTHSSPKLDIPPQPPGD